MVAGVALFSAHVSPTRPYCARCSAARGATIRSSGRCGGMTRENETTLRKAAIWIGLAAGVFLAWELRPAILLAFGAVMLGAVFDLLTEGVCRVSGIRRGWSFAIATTIIIAVIALFIWLFGMNLSQQFSQVMQRVTTG